MQPRGSLREADYSVGTMWEKARELSSSNRKENAVGRLRRTTWIYDSR